LSKPVAYGFSTVRFFSEVTTMELIQEVAHWVNTSQRIVVLTGAGISTDSGIPDFRGPQGVWTRNPAAEKQSTIQNYLADQKVRIAAWQSRLANPAWTAQPNAGHRAIVALERRGKLHALITQNIDELHQHAGTSAAKVIEVHGTIRRVMCWACGRRDPMETALKRVRDGEADPHCLSCGGILKSDTISFGQALVPEVIDQAMEVASEADLFIAIGSTLQVFPVAGVVPLAKKAGARVVILNAQPTAMDDQADALLNGSISEVLPVICGSM
jgi:NAD-dependent deacetylase